MKETQVKKILGELIRESFPSLKGRKIYLYFKTKKKYTGGSFWILPFWRVLLLNKDRKLNNKELTGLLAHELSHFDTYQRRGWIVTAILGALYFISPSFRRKEEDRVEKLAIERGYARETYSLAKRLDRIKRKSGLARYYSTPEDLKSYAKKIGKW